MYIYDRRHWLQHLFHLRGSVLPVIIPRILIFLWIGCGVVLAFQYGFLSAIPLGVHGLLGSVLGLILAFRTHTGYDRYWEGRKAWGAVVNRCRNLALKSHAAYQVGVFSLQDAAFLNACARLFPWAMRADLLHLQQKQKEDPEFFRVVKELQDEDVIAAAELISLRACFTEKNSPPQQVLLKLEVQLEKLQTEKVLDSVDRKRFSDDSTVLIDALGVCHRIQKTPIPFAYAVYLRRVLAMYLCTLPVALVESMGWSTLWILGLVAFALLGLEQIGVEIENPFEEGANDLHLFGIASAIESDVIALASGLEASGLEASGAVS